MEYGETELLFPHNSIIHVNIICSAENKYILLDIVSHAGEKADKYSEILLKICDNEKRIQQD